MLDEEFDLFGYVDGFVRRKVSSRQFVADARDDGQGFGIERFRFPVVAHGNQLIRVWWRALHADAR